MDKNTLYRFFEGSSSPEEEMHIRQWMEAGIENKEMFLKERFFFDASTLLAETAPKEKKNRLHPRRTWIMREVLKAAAIAAFVWAGVYGYYHKSGGKGTVAMQTISVPAGQRVNLLLPDGTKVWLNARTTLKYPVSFNEEERAMELDGEAYFEVAKDEKRPFVVHTDKGSITALGTTFNVEDYTSDNEFITTLMSGSVRITPKNNSAAPLVLTSDRKAVWTGDSLRVEAIDDYTVYRWVEGLICFKNESVPAMMKELEKYYGVRIHVKNQQVLLYSYTGKFRHTDGIDYALRVLQKDISFKYVRDDENQIIYIE
ncbi:MAG: FecR domain-containing protein [Tannerellaceae bacterium]|jgi:ferric-dicitrate binding protein FerR (iron transport regulator)|nr:FecR domain-containing protein [Tannerellaceae bacterium]